MQTVEREFQHAIPRGSLFMKTIRMRSLTVHWRDYNNPVTAWVDSSGWTYDFDDIRGEKNDAGQFKIPPHTTDDELIEEFERDLCETNLGKYMGNLVGGDGEE